MKKRMLIVLPATFAVLVGSNLFTVASATSVQSSLNETFQKPAITFSQQKENRKIALQNDYALRQVTVSTITER